jgi:CRISPR-associated endonuclease/helicase Cas3
MSFDQFFEIAVEDKPLPFQRRFAEADSLPQLVRVPTGLGKTAMAVVGWLWRRLGASAECRAATPRRLVYCLPMRVLVEQTAENARNWLGKLRVANAIEGDGPAVHVLMGGENSEEWDLYPEREAILVGTQDMLLSRALNRGYAASRARWPIQFGILHTDCLWVFDEIQLMGAGLATTAQLEAFRRTLPHQASEPSRASRDGGSVWMSATMQRDWLETVDFAPFAASAPKLEFDFETEIATARLDEKVRKTLESRWNAEKPLAKSPASGGDMESLAREVLQAHKSGSRTIIVVNTVRRACKLFAALESDNRGDEHKRNKRKGVQSSGSETAPSSTVAPRIILLHSRFRREDRQKHLDDALADPTGAGSIVVSTQVIEAGVDVSATTLFTELAPWASLVQRFGRCNRRGADNDHAQIFWIDLPKGDAEAKTETLPYELDDLKKSAVELEKLTDVGLKPLSQLPIELRFEHTHVVRRKDLIDLFDSTPDLAGNDIDIDRFVREIDESDVRIFWRHWDRPKGHESPPDDEPAPRRDELCPAPIGSDKNSGFRQFAKERGGDIWRWNFLDKKWESAIAGKIVPGQVYLVHADAGGYSSELGWDPRSMVHVEPIGVNNGENLKAPDANDADQPSQSSVWQTIAEHVDDVCTELKSIVNELPRSDFEAQAMQHAARWHDRGKAHAVFQAALPGVPDSTKIWAKATGVWKRYDRPHFRHELASALVVLDPHNDKICDGIRDLVAYLVAAHHGKVRLSIRSLPNEHHPPPRPHSAGGDRRFARGIWDGDQLPETDLGGGVTAPAATLSLEPMELGLCAEPPFADLPSWAERMLRLRDQLGPFRLAYLEALVRAADMRASRDAERREAETQNRAAAAARETLGG